MREREVRTDGETNCKSMRKGNFGSEDILQEVYTRSVDLT